jgi:anti-sigma regulatory factor (Ser/Thr protein kinase)
MDERRATCASGVSFRVALACNLAEVRPATLAVRGFLERQQVPEADLASCELALAEACNNAIQHAPESAWHCPVEVQVICDGGKIELRVTDHTAGFDWPNHAELPALDSERGRGVYFIQHLMDEAAYLRGADANCLVMSKAAKLPRRGHLGAIAEANECWPTSSYNTASPEVEQKLSLKIAEDIQRSLLPRDLPVIPGFSLAGYCKSARPIGGDFYDVVPLKDGSLLLVIVDVMGHGVPSALFAAEFHSLARVMPEWVSKPCEVLARANQLMFDELAAVDMFVTAQVAFFDPRCRQLRLANAGHCPALLANSKGQIRQIAPEGMPLGLLRDCPFEDEIVEIEPNSKLLLFTDGVIDTENPIGDRFGLERLQNWLGHSSRRRQSKGETLKFDLASDLARFQGSASLCDDQTFLLLSAGPRAKESGPKQEPNNL